MDRIVQPGSISGVITAPPSKSSLQRAIACATLAEGVSRLEVREFCSDALAALGIAENLGAEVHRDDASVCITGTPEIRKKSREPLELDCGESGLCMRMFAPIVALLDRPVTLRAHGSLQSRSIGMAEAPLRALGAGCDANQGRPPLYIHGPLRGGFLHFDPGGSSQFLTGLLIALPLLPEDSTIIVDAAPSSGYLDLTIEVCRQFGVSIDVHPGRLRFMIKGGQTYRPTNYVVEGDWSAAAFLIVASAIAGSHSGVRIDGLRIDSTQPDRAILDAASLAGVRTIWEDGSLRVFPSEIGNFDFDASGCPDLFPPLAVLAAAGKGKSRILGIHRLHGKESDRATAIGDILLRLGIHTEISGDDLLISGGKFIGREVRSFNDHRIAMAAAVAGLAADGPVVISGSECVSKSWPGFFASLEALKVV